MRFLGFALLLASGAAVAAPTYHVQMSLARGAGNPEPTAMVVREGETGSIDVSGESGFGLDLTVTPAAPNPKTGAERVDVQLRIVDHRPSSITVLGEPRLTVELGTEASISVGPDTPVADSGYSLSLTVTRFTDAPIAQAARTR